MNKNSYKQYDTRWSKLGYPKKPWLIGNCGCGEVSICNCIIEMNRYAKQTPKTIQPYCKQFAEPHGNGTYFSGIPTMMKHYGMTEVKEHQTMAQLWKELAKGDRVAIYLMGNRSGGNKGVHWTSSAHFVCSVGYKVKNGKHYVYVKDSNSTSSLRNGWITYEDNMRNDVSRVWSGKLPKSTAPTTPTKKSDPLQKWYDAMKTQYNWSKNQKYKWVTPTVESSKTKGTCITFPIVSLQRLGLIGKGKYFYFHPQEKKITGTASEYVKKHTELFQLSYPNKTINELWKAGKIKKGDIIGFGNPYYHTMVFMGMKNGKPIFNTMGSKRGLGIYYPLYAKRKVNMIVRLKKTTK